MDDGYLRMGEFSQRVGVSPELLRAWERRYGLLAPSRSAGGFRLYSDDDATRVGRMLTLLDQGLSAAQAARSAIAGMARGAPGGQPVPGAAAGAPDGLALAATDLGERLEAFDDAASQALLDDLLARFSLETVLAAVLMPCLARIGERWAAGEISVAQEHFASNLIRGRLLSLARGWDRGPGRRAVLAAPPGEFHDIGLVAFGLAARNLGWKITFLGADTPSDALAWAVTRLEPSLVVVAATTPEPLQAARRRLRALAAEAPLLLAGAGASPALARSVGAGFTEEGPVEAARTASEPAA